MSKEQQDLHAVTAHVVPAATSASDLDNVF
jgi:hypothetical protein